MANGRSISLRLALCVATLVMLPWLPCAPAAPEESSKPTTPDRSPDKTPPERVQILPVFFVPLGQPPPTQPQIDLMMDHLKRAQARYGELLRQDTFAIAEQGPKVYLSQRPVSFYRDCIAGSAAQFAAELFADLKCNRFNCRYVFLVFVANHDPTFSRCGARTLNGGFNNGGGIAEMTCDFTRPDGFQAEHPAGIQSTVQHELGHAFGLSHPDAYGYGLDTNGSLMSYNPGTFTDGFAPARTPGILIPEDLQRLSLNKRVFAGYRFDPARDVPAGYKLKEAAEWPPMAIPGQEAMPGQDESPPFDARPADKVPLIVKVRLKNDGEHIGCEAAWIGSKGKGQPMLGFSVELPEKIPGVQLQYTAGISTLDDVPWVDAGNVLSKAQLDSTAGKQTADDPSVPLTGIAFRLTGESSEKYDVWYRGHFAFVGDSAWSKNGGFCGSRAPDFQPLESFVVVVVPR